MPGLLLLVLILLGILFHLTISTLAAPIDLDSISQTASLRYIGKKTYSDTHLDGSLRVFTQIELYIPGETLILEISDSTSSSDSPITNSEYEEVIHDVSLGSSTPNLDIIRQGNDHQEIASLNKCLYSGRVKDKDHSVVSLNTCSGKITGMIRLLDGRLFSVEPDLNPKPSSPGQQNPQYVINNQYNRAVLRRIARQGNLQQLAKYTPSIILVDSIAEAELERENEKAFSEQQQHNPAQREP